MKFSGKSALVTGGSRGIGAAIVKRLAQEHLRVAFFYKQSSELADSILQWASERQLIVVPVQCDISDLDSLEKALTAAKANVGPIDYLVNNAGIAHYRIFTEEAAHDVATVLRTDLESAMILTKEVAKGMIIRRYGAIVNISSIWGLYGSAMEVSYSAAKGGLISFTKALAKELGPSNVRVNCVVPGVIQTDMLDRFSKEEIADLCSRIPLGRLGDAEEVASAVAFLLSDEASYITGSILEVSGGFIS